MNSKHRNLTDERARYLQVRYAVLSVMFTSCRDTLRDSQIESTDVAHTEQMVTGSGVQKAGTRRKITESGVGDSVLADPAVV